MSLIHLELHPLQAEQLEQVVALDQLCLGGLWNLAGYQREIASPNSTLLAISLAETVIGIGCLWAILEEAHIIILIVHPDYQGQGLGKLLFTALLQDALNRRLERATLEVAASNQVALSLYKKFGFHIAGKRKQYYANGEDALILWRSGLDRPKFAQDLSTWQQEVYEKLLENNWHILVEDSLSRIEEGN